MLPLDAREALLDALWRLRRGETDEALRAAEIGAEATDGDDDDDLPPWEDWDPASADAAACVEFAAALRDNRPLDAATIAERELWPAHQSAGAALEAYETAMRASRAGRI